MAQIKLISTFQQLYGLLSRFSLVLRFRKKGFLWEIAHDPRVISRKCDSQNEPDAWTKSNFYGL